jgi:hypothetical protein
MWTKNMGKKWV